MFQDIETDRELLGMLKRSADIVASMTHEEREQLHAVQRESWIRSCAPCEHGRDWEECPHCWEATGQDA